MPDRPLHNKIAKLLGIDPKLADRVNKEVDEPSQVLGWTHRIARHDLFYALMASQKYGPRSLEAFRAYLIHYMLDKMYDDALMRGFLLLLDRLLPD